MEINLFVIMVLVAIVLPITFRILDYIEDWIENKYGDETSRKFIIWTWCISIGILVVAVLSIILTTYFDPMFVAHKLS